MVLHRRECELDWIIIGRVGWQELDAHTSKCQRESQPTSWMDEWNLPRFNKVDNGRVLVNPTIIHYNNWIGGRKRLHLGQEATDECVEEFSIEGAFNDVTMYNAIIQGERRKYRKPSMRIRSWLAAIGHMWNSPSPTAEKCLASGFPATYGPSSSTVRCTAVHWTLVYKNNLIWIISSDTSCIFSTFHCAAFKCCPR